MQFGGVFEGDLALEGAQLDLAQGDIEALRQSIITDIATILPSGDQIVLVPAKWDIKTPFLVALAASLGYTIYIRDYTISMSDWLCADDELIEAEPMSLFSAGCGAAGESLASFDYWLNWIWEVVVVSSPENTPVPSLGQVLNNLKPAHIMLNFTWLPPSASFDSDWEYDTGTTIDFDGGTVVEVG